MATGYKYICLPVAAGWLIDVIGDTGISVRVPVRCSLHRGQCKEMQIVEWEIFAFNFDWCVIYIVIINSSNKILYNRVIVYSTWKYMKNTPCKQQAIPVFQGFISSLSNFNEHLLHGGHRYTKTSYAKLILTSYMYKQSFYNKTM